MDFRVSHYLLATDNRCIHSRRVSTTLLWNQLLQHAELSIEIQHTNLQELYRLRIAMPNLRRECTLKEQTSSRFNSPLAYNTYGRDQWCRLTFDRIQSCSPFKIVIHEIRAKLGPFGENQINLCQSTWSLWFFTRFHESRFQDGANNSVISWRHSVPWYHIRQLE